MWWTYIFAIRKKSITKWKEITDEQLLILITHSPIQTVRTDWKSIQKIKKKMTLQINYYIITVVIAIFIIMALLQIITLIKLKRVSRRLWKQKKYARELDIRLSSVERTMNKEYHKADKANGPKQNQETVQDYETSSNIEATDDKNKKVNESVKTTQALTLKNEYLKTGQSNQTFFFKGDEINHSGAYFKVTYYYDSQNLFSDGKLDIIDGTNISNIKTMDFSFRINAIRIKNENIITLQDATNYEQTHSGKLKYNNNDKVWDIKSPVEIKLIK